MRTTSMLLVLALAGCDTPGTIDASVDAQGLGDGGDPATRGATRFSSDAFAWPVPTRSGDGFATVAGSGWALVDLDGDHRADLVETSEPGSRAVIGEATSPRWRVYRNLGDRFEPTPASWPVPAAPELSGGFGSTGGDGWALIDLDADGRADLVWSRDPATRAVFGSGTSPHWRVYRNEGNGFASTPALWSVPAGPAPQGFDMASGEGWAVLDLDGDHRPDLAWTTDPSSDAVWGLGASPYWRVHRNEGSGFASAPASWPVPAAVELTDGFSRAFDSSWTTLDFDGDARPDLVWTRDPTSRAVWGLGASPHWRVYRNGGSGFGAEALVAVPTPAGIESGFDAIAGDGWTTLDVDGDARPDLVWTRDPQTGRVHGDGASPHWLVYPNRGDAFSIDAAAFVVPTGIPGGFDSVAGDGWATLDLDGAGAIDLVWTHDAASDAVFGSGASPHWQVFVGRR